MIALFSRSSAPPDLEDAVRRRIVGAVVEPRSAAAVPAPSVRQPTPASIQTHVDESPGSLLQNLAGILTRTGVEISTVHARKDGFLVSGALGGDAFQKWYSVHEVGQLAATKL